MRRFPAARRILFLAVLPAAFGTAVGPVFEWSPWCGIVLTLAFVAVCALLGWAEIRENRRSQARIAAVTRQYRAMNGEAADQE